MLEEAGARCEGFRSSQQLFDIDRLQHNVIEAIAIDFRPRKAGPARYANEPRAAEVRFISQPGQYLVAADPWQARVEQNDIRCEMFKSRQCSLPVRKAADAMTCTFDGQCQALHDIGVVFHDNRRQ